MKTLLILFLTLTALQLQAHAQATTDDFNYTGEYAINVGTVANPAYEVTSGPIAVGGAGASDDSGYASEFTITAPVTISAIDVSAIVSNPYNEPSTVTNDNPTTLTYQIYTGTTLTPFNQQVPNVDTLLSSTNTLSFQAPTANGPTSAPVTVTATATLQSNTTLQPGNYWLAESGQGPAEVETQQTYIDPPSGGIPTAAAPEPPSFWLMLIGIILVGFKIYKKKLKVA